MIAGMSLSGLPAVSMLPSVVYVKKFRGFNTSGAQAASTQIRYAVRVITRAVCRIRRRIASGNSRAPDS